MADMNQDHGQEDRDELVNERSQALAGKATSNTQKNVMIGVMVVVFLILAVLLLAPQQVRQLFGGGTSSSEKMQETSTADDGISTEMTIPEAVDTEPDSVEVPEAMPRSEPDNSAYLDQIEELERQLEALRGQSGTDPAAIKELLDQQAALLREQFEQEREMRQAEFERQLAAAREAANSMSDEEAAARARLEEERARREAIAREQINSDGLVIDGSGRVNGAGSQPGGADRELTSNESFMAAATTQSYDTVRATTIANPSRTIVQGTTLEATLETAISTELPGIIRAVISHDVYSYDGQNVLLPRGSRLIGSYNSDVSIAQNRAQLAWNRAITPSGVSVELGGYGADELGMSGQTGHVDTRFGKRFGTAALISLIGLTPQFIVAENSDNENSQDLAEDLSGDLQNQTQSVLNDYLSLPPVIYIGQGTKLSVIVNRDLVF